MWQQAAHCLAKLHGRRKQCRRQALFERPAQRTISGRARYAFVHQLAADINKVAIAAFGAFLIVVFNSAYGVINARKQRVMAARVMGASRWQIFRDVLVWESMQPTFVGLRSAVSMALVIVIVAEMFIGSDTGLGHRIIDTQQVMNVRGMYAAILSAGVLGYALNILFLVAEKRIVHWSGR